MQFVLGCLLSVQSTFSNLPNQTLPKGLAFGIWGTLWVHRELEDPEHGHFLTIFFIKIREND